MKRYFVVFVFALFFAGIMGGCQVPSHEYSPISEGMIDESSTSLEATVEETVSFSAEETISSIAEETVSSATEEMISSTKEEAIPSSTQETAPEEETVLANNESSKMKKAKKNVPSLPEYTPDDYAMELFAKVNEARVSYGLEPLVWDPMVSSLAYVRAQEASVQWSHTRPNGGACYTVYEEYGIRRVFWTGENLANYALQDATLIVDSWMASEAHKTNILYPDYTAAGMAVYWSGEKYYIANLFRS